MKKHIFLPALVLFVSISFFVESTGSMACPAISTEDPVVYNPGDCRFKINDLYGGSFLVDQKSHFKGGVYSSPSGQQWSFSMTCHFGVKPNEIDDQLAAKKVDGKWIWQGTNEPFTADQHFKALSFNGRNWRGTGITYDDTTGDESARGENLFFCLVEIDGPQVLCGGPISVRSLSDPPATSTLTKIIAVLKTIQFVDSAPVAQAPSNKPADN